MKTSRVSASRPIGESKKATAFSRETSLKSSSKKTSFSTDRMRGTLGTKTPTPLDFDNFIPWVVKELHGSKLVVVKRMMQAEYGRRSSAKRTSSQTTTCKTVRFSQSGKGSERTDKTHFTMPTFAVETASSLPLDFDPDAIQITAYYDSSGHLVEIAFIDCSLPINRQVIKVISLCLPFHALLTKLTIKERKLNCGILYEIAKLLPFSNLTDICLDSSFVPQGNYYILLDQATTLKCLSLSNCNISDVVCKEIAERIEFQRAAAKNLLVLNLSYNRITDVGAKALGRSLRTNCHLLHLNLCNNKLSVVGAAHILVHLSKFPLTSDEIKEARRRRKEYFEKKIAAADECLKEIRLNHKVTETSVTSKSVSSVSQGSSKRCQQRKKPVVDIAEVIRPSEHEIAEEMAVDIVGPYEDSFSPLNTFLEDGHRFCIGNLTLCSLNLAYNNLDFTTVAKIVDVLSYQYRLEKHGRTGLMRVVIEGNNLPDWCIEYDLINMYLSKVTNDFMPPPAPPAKKSSLSLKGRSRSVLSVSQGGKRNVLLQACS